MGKAREINQDLEVAGGKAIQRNAGNTAFEAVYTNPDYYKYSIVTSVASNNLTVALKNYLGTDPSVTTPVKFQDGNGIIRTITGALSVTLNAGTSWMNLGSSELATKEVDLFTYLGYNITDGVVIGFSRIPNARVYSDFSATTTNEKYAGISTITNAISTDKYINIGRFNAILSAGAGYTWSIPATSKIINYPILENSLNDYTPTIGGVTLGNGEVRGKYKIIGNKVSGYAGFFANTTSSFSSTFTITLPFTFAPGYLFGGKIGINGWGQCAGSEYSFLGHIDASTNIMYPKTTASPAVAVSNTSPGTWAANTNNFIYMKFEYYI